MPDNFIILPEKEFHEHAKNKETENFGVRKGFTCDYVKTIDEGKRQIKFTISTESIDRMGDSISVKGWELDNFKKNPVVLFSHDHYSPPVGRAVSIVKRPKLKKLEAIAEFADKDVYPFADSIFQMYVAGFMRATSVGFRPLEWEFANEDGEDENRPRYGIDFKRHELLEFSTVSVPANPECLNGARSKGIDTMPFKEYAENALDDYDNLKEKGFVIARKTLEQLYKHSDPKQPASVYKVSEEQREKLKKENLERIKQQQEKEGKTMKLEDINPEALRSFLEESKTEDLTKFKDYFDALNNKDLEAVSDSLANTLGEREDDDLVMTDETKELINQVVTDLGKEWDMDTSELLFVVDEGETPCKELTEEEIERQEQEEKNKEVETPDETDTDDETVEDPDKSETEEENKSEEDGDDPLSQQDDPEKELSETDYDEKAVEQLREYIDSFIKSVEDGVVKFDDYTKYRSGKRALKTLQEAANDVASLIGETLIDPEKTETPENKEQGNEEDTCEMVELSIESDLETNQPADDEEKDLTNLDMDLLDEVIREQVETTLKQEITSAINKAMGKVD